MSPSRKRHSTHSRPAVAGPRLILPCKKLIDKEPGHLFQWHRKDFELNVNSGFETYEKHRNTSCHQSNTNLPKTSMKYLDRKIKLYLLKIFIFLLNHDTESIYPNLLVSKLENYRAISAILQEVLRITYVGYWWKHNAHLKANLQKI